jgi:putative exporter of polyketide antibiotics
LSVIDRIFLEHPRTVRESYAGHMLVAWSFGLRLLGASVACMVHGIVPCLFKQTASRRICELHDEMVTHRVRHEHR